MTKEIEEILERSSLLSCSRALDDRIDGVLQDSTDSPQTAELAESPLRISSQKRNQNSSKSSLWIPAAAAIAAALALASFIWKPWSDTSIPIHTDHPKQAHAQTDPFQPVRFDETQVGITPGEVFLIDKQTPVRLLHRRSLNHTRWVDETNNVRIELTVPQEEFFIVPVRIE